MDNTNKLYKYDTAEIVKRVIEAILNSGDYF